MSSCRTTRISRPLKDTRIYKTSAAVDSLFFLLTKSIAFLHSQVNVDLEELKAMRFVAVMTSFRQKPDYEINTRIVRGKCSFQE